MSRNRVDATTAKVWRRYQCLGGPHDGLIVSVAKRARNVILIGPDGKAHEYLDMSVDELSPVLAFVAVVGTELGTCVRRIEYSGWLTDRELRYAKQLAAGS